MKRIPTLVNVNGANYQCWRPFDPALGRQGAPIMTKEGQAVRVICWDRNNHGYCVVGLLPDVAGDERVGCWDVHGDGSPAYKVPELVMAPVGWCEGRPLFCGDVLYLKDETSTEFMVLSHHAKDFTFDNMAWTKPLAAAVLEVKIAAMNTEHLRSQFEEVVKKLTSPAPHMLHRHGDEYDNGFVKFAWTVAQAMQGVGKYIP